MKVVNANHPITKGLPPVWMHQGDELYARLRGPGENMDVLVTAYSDKNNRGTGYDELQLFTVSYGKGRVVHFTPGHDAAGMSSVDYVVLLQRATEWAASGKVTQRIPDDFPTATTVSYRVDIAEMSPGYKNGFGGVMGGVRPNATVTPPRRDSTSSPKTVSP
jgi:trehalose utilization protein